MGFSSGSYSVLGSNSSHEVAALCLTETISHSLNVNKEPAFVLLCDAQSAYDVTPVPHIIRSAYLAGTLDQGLLYLNGCLKSRRTFLDLKDTIVTI